MLKIGWKRCPYCDGNEVYRSRTEPLTWLDRVRGLLLLELVRFHRCQLRHYRPIFFPAPEYPHSILSREKRAQTHAVSDKRERSA